MNFDHTAAQLDREEYARIRAAVTPRLEAFCSMTRDEFRDEIAGMVERLGHELITLAPELVTVKDGRKYIIACATPADRLPVKTPAIRHLHHAVTAGNAARGIYVTPRRFTPDAEYY